MFLARHAWQTKHPPHSTCPAERGWTWWSVWTEEERARFFHALGVRSRLRPDLIAQDLGTRSTVEVCAALDHFARLSRRVVRRELAMLDTPHRRRQSRRRRMLERLPAAYEMTDRWLAWEEAHATRLLANECDDGEPSAPVSYEEQVHNVSLFLRRSQTYQNEVVVEEALGALVGRLVHVDQTWDHLPDAVEPTQAYSASSKKYALPPLYVRDAVCEVVEALEKQGHIVPVDGAPGALASDGMPLTRMLRWLDDPLAQDCPARAELLRGRDRALEQMAASVHGETFYLYPQTMDALSRALYAFLVHVMWELITVGERSHLRDIDRQFVWATVARLGYVEPAGDVSDRARSVAYGAEHAAASNAAETSAPSAVAATLRRNIPLQPDLLAEMAELRAVADPPVAWHMPMPVDEPGVESTSRRVLPEALDVSDESSSSTSSASDSAVDTLDISESSVTDASYEADSFVDDADVEDAYRIGDLATLGPYEYVQETDPYGEDLADAAAGDRAGDATDAAGGQVADDGADDGTDDTDDAANDAAEYADNATMAVCPPLDTHVDADDAAAAAVYEQRVWREWFGHP